MPQTESLRVPVQARAQRTRAAIVRAAQQEFSERGYAVATSKSIADRAGVGTGTFYHYFPDKDVVLRELAKERADALLEETTRIDAIVNESTNLGEVLAWARGYVAGVVHAFIAYHKSDRGLHAVVTERRLSDCALDAAQTATEHEGVRRLAGWLSSWGHGPDAMATAYMIFSLLDGSVHGHVLGQPLLDDTTFANALVEAVMRLLEPRAQGASAS